MSAVDANGKAIDLAQGFDLTNQNAALFAFLNLAACIDLNGTNQYLSYADNAHFDILGTESYVASDVRGLTMGGLFYIDDFDATNGEGLIGKDGAAGQRSYVLYNLNGTLKFAVSPDGTIGNQVEVSSSETVSEGKLFFVVVRFKPGIELAIFVNGKKTVNTTNVPASIFNSAANFEIGRMKADNAYCLNGYAAHGFLCCEALSDMAIKVLIQWTKNSWSGVEPPPGGGG